MKWKTYGRKLLMHMIATLIKPYKNGTKKDKIKSRNSIKYLNFYVLKLKFILNNYLI